jgi:hypothetical protein
MIIGFTGRKFHGKDTAAKQLLGYTPMSFASPMKETVKLLFGFSEDQVNGTLKEDIDVRWNISPREALQFVGTEMFREHIQLLLPDVGGDFWVRSLENRIPKDVNVVITDVRFPNEVAMIHRMGGKVIRVKRYVSDNSYGNHISEQHIDLLDVDYEIDNNGTIEQLHDCVNNIERSLADSV